MRQNSFEAQLEIGRKGEKLVEKYLKDKGYGVIASYDFNGKNGDKAPRLMFTSSRHAIPDLDICNDGKRYWVEVKTYATSPMNYTHGFQVHGFVRRLYLDYLEVERQTGTPVLLWVVERDTRTILCQRLASMPKYGCLCGACRQGAPDDCCAHIRDGVYFNREDFKVVAEMSEQEMDSAGLLIRADT